jgi:hypothetical protein
MMYRSTTAQPIHQEATASRRSRRAWAGRWPDELRPLLLLAATALLLTGCAATHRTTDPATPLAPSASAAVEVLAPSRLTDPPIPETEDLEVQITTFETRADIPTSLGGGDTVITTGLGYQQLRLDYANRQPAAGELVEAAHGINCHFSWFQQFDDSWAMLTLLSPGIASDLQGELSFDDLVLEAALVGVYSFSERFAVGLGAGYNPRLGMQFPMPVLALRWLPMPMLRFEAIMPQNATVAFLPHPIISLGLEGTLEGGSYHGDPDRYGVANPQLRYSLAKAGPTVTVNPAPWLHLQLAGGYGFMRRLEFFDGTDELGSFDLNGAAYARAGIALGGG